MAAAESAEIRNGMKLDKVQSHLSSSNALFLIWKMNTMYYVQWVICVLWVQSSLKITICCTRSSRIPQFTKNPMKWKNDMGDRLGGTFSTHIC